MTVQQKRKSEWWMGMKVVRKKEKRKKQKETVGDVVLKYLAMSDKKNKKNGGATRGLNLNRNR